jgi:hypothetical protein
MNILDQINTIPFGNPTCIYYNGKTKFFINKNYDSSMTNFQPWGEFGMMTRANGPIVSFIFSNAPENTAIICYGADYNFPIPDELSRLFKRCLVIVRYTGIPNSIVIPGDDKFFETPEFYCPKVWMQFEERKHQVFWRGSCTAERRLDVVTALKDVPGTDVRLIRNINYQHPYWNKLPELFAERCDPDHPSKHTIWLSIEGWGCASDTTRALMSGCAVIYFRITAPWFDQFLIHEENCIIVENNISKLLYYVNRMINDTEFTKTIAENGKTLSEKIFKPEFFKQFILNQLI